MWQKFKNYYHLGVAVLACTWYGFPAKNLIVIGVTGTDGKTTTTNLIYHILHSAGYNASMVSTVGANINGKVSDVGLHVTTPSSWIIQKFLKKAAESGASKKYMVLEVTSHAIDQYRIWGIDFDIAVLTNITNEHLDYHKTYKNYVLTKAKLLQKARCIVVNRDDQSYEIIQSMIKHKKHTLYGMEIGDITPGKFPFKTKIFGKYNTYNILAGIAVCKQLGLSDDSIRKGIGTFVLPKGRAEIVYTGDFSIMVDFAHTSNAFEKLLSSVKKETKGKLIHVFGSAGKRDFAKRPKMGEISTKYADITIITADDPRTESVDDIAKQILSGIKDYETKIKQKTLFCINDRQSAIDKAVSLARKGDFVVLTGKAHEKTISMSTGEQPWSDYEAAEKALKLKK